MIRLCAHSDIDIFPKILYIAGIFGLFGLKKGKCRAFGIVIFIFAIVSVVLALPTISVNSIVTAVLAWLFIVCV